MSRARATVALATALTVLAALCVPAAAQAAPRPAGHDAASVAVAALDPSKAEFTVKVLYRPTPSATPVKLSPTTQVEVSFWKLDTVSGFYYQQAQGTWTEGGPDEVDTSAALDPGRYSIRFLAHDTSIGSEWFDGARYFYESADVDVIAGQSLDLGTVVLEPRTFDVDRVSGGDRFSTAVAASMSTIPDGSAANVVYLTNGMNYPDALAAGPAAISQGGVLLLTQTNSLPAVTLDELARIHPKRVVIVGGTGAVSDAVMADVMMIMPGTPVDRIGGASRYQTGELVVDDAFSLFGADIAIIATGSNYPDALAAGPAAGYLGAPVILVNGTAALPASTTQLLVDLGVSQVVVLGGTAVVSSAIQSDLAGIVGSANVFRIAGGSRYDTAAQLNAAVFDPTDFAFVASGANFPDALAGAPMAGAFGAPLFLTRPDCLNREANSGILASRANGVILLGGTGALSNTVANLSVCK